jgi:hypothetical protein
VGLSQDTHEINKITEALRQGGSKEGEGTIASQS